MMTVTELMTIYQCTGITELAKRIGVSRQAVHNWINDGRIPEDREIRIRYEALMAASVATKKTA